MKKILFTAIIVSGLMQWSAFAQNCHVSTVKYQYANGLATFSICNGNPTQSFPDDQTIYWYSEAGGIKSTKGGCGGKLLHGLYQFSDESGNLLEQTNFTLGRKHGRSTNWDESGNIVAQSDYKNGVLIYWKFLNDEMHWIEWTGTPLSEGSVKRVSRYNTLLEQDSTITVLTHEITQYFPISGNLKSRFTSYGFKNEFFIGDYALYFDNKQPEVIGSFYKPTAKDEHDLHVITSLNIRDGDWTWYNFDGTVKAQEKYKAYVSRWDSGQLRECGQLFWDKDELKWVKDGMWESYSDGYFLGVDSATRNISEYDNGVLVEK